mmetsp:Transcript_2029/g.4685  ORF Transcript_2029/g.4685 Transcript_2029/m.4685 type:complete len:179 (-) Transcript_2029:145-681(-)
MEHRQKNSRASRPPGSGGRTVVLSESSANADTESVKFSASLAVKKKGTGGANANNNADDADYDNNRMDIDDSAVTGGGAVVVPTVKLSAEKREEIEANIDKLLVHAATCDDDVDDDDDDDSGCRSTCCVKWTDLKLHAFSCSAETSECSRCRMYWMAIRVHCRRCNDEQCKVPECAQE